MLKQICFQNSKGDKLCGILSHPIDDTKKPIVILCHGFTTSKDNRTNTLLEKILNKNNIATFRFDFFGHGESEGLLENITISEAVDDILCAIEFLKKRSYSKIALIGSSFGGLAGIMAAARADDLFALALKAPVSNFKEIYLIAQSSEKQLRDWKEKGYSYYPGGDGKKYKINYTFFADFDNNNGYEAAKNIEIPVLIVHGDADERVPIEQSRKTAALMPRARLVALPNCGHLFERPGDFEKMVDLIADFIIEQSKK